MIKTRNDALIELGFEPNSNPSKEEIKKNYHKKALEVHPDRNPSEDANAKFVILKEAFAFFQNPQSNSVFTTKNSTDLFPNFNINNFFSSFFDDVEITPYKMHASTVSRDRYNNSCFGRDYYIKDAQDLRRQCQRFTNIDKLTILDLELKLPPEGPEIILTTLLGNQKLYKVMYPANFFDETQVKRLAAHLGRNNVKRTNTDNKNRERLMLLLGAVIGLYFALMGGSSVLLSVALGGFSAYIITKVHQTYLKFAARYYGTHHKITAVNSQTEQSALLAGLKAKKIDGYLKSFIVTASYRHPLAFAAGLFHALEYNYTIKQLIRSSKPNEVYSPDIRQTKNRKQ